MAEVKVSNKIYNKDFEIKALGYDCREVDTFLDEINLEIAKLEREIENLDEKIRLLEGSNARLDSRKKELERDLYNERAHNTVTNASTANFSNMDLYNRISSLENIVKKILEKVDK